MNYRLVMAIIIVIVLITGGILEEYAVNKIFTQLAEKIEIILQTEGDYEIAQIQENYEWFKKHHRYMEFVLPHFQLNELAAVYGELIGAVQCKDKDAATILLNKIYAYSQSLEEMFEFRLGNIL